MKLAVLISLLTVINSAPVPKPEPIQAKEIIGYVGVAGAGVLGGVGGYYGAKALFGRKKKDSEKKDAANKKDKKTSAKGPVASAVESTELPSSEQTSASPEPAGQPIPEDFKFLLDQVQRKPKTPIEQATNAAITSSSFPDLRTALQPPLPNDAGVEKVTDTKVEPVA